MEPCHDSGQSYVAKRLTFGEIRANDLQQNQGGDNNMQHAEKRGVFMRKRIAKLFVHYLAIL